MFSAITLDDSTGAAVTLHRTSRRAVRRASGLLGVGGIRAAIRDRPTAHGAINDTRWQSGQLVVLEGYVYDPSPDLALVELREIERVLIETLDNGAALLKWTELTSGLALQRAVRLSDDFLPPLQAGPALIEYQAQVFAEDPRAYSQTLVTATGGVMALGGGATVPRTFPVTFNPAAGGTVAVNNTGNRPTPPVLRIYGGVTNPQVVLVGKPTCKVALIGTIDPGNYVELDTQRRTIRLNGTSPAQNLYDAANSAWFELPRGTSTLQLLGTTFDTNARVDVLYRSAYS